MSLLRLLGIGRYWLPSLKGCPNTNHNRVRQTCADNDDVVNEVCITPNPQGAVNCPECLHGIEFHDGYCRVSFRQTDHHGIIRDDNCCCLMTPQEIRLNVQVPDAPDVEEWCEHASIHGFTYGGRHIFGVDACGLPVKR